MTLPAAGQAAGCADSLTQLPPPFDLQAPVAALPAGATLAALSPLTTIIAAAAAQQVQQAAAAPSPAAAANRRLLADAPAQAPGQQQQASQPGFGIAEDGGSATGTSYGDPLAAALGADQAAYNLLSKNQVGWVGVCLRGGAGQQARTGNLPCAPACWGVAAVAAWPACSAVTAAALGVLHAACRVLASTASPPPRVCACRCHTFPYPTHALPSLASLKSWCAPFQRRCNFFPSRFLYVGIPQELVCTGSVGGALLAGLAGGGATPAAGAAALFAELARDLLAGSPFNLTSQESVQVGLPGRGRWCCDPMPAARRHHGGLHHRAL